MRLTSCLILSSLASKTTAALLEEGLDRRRCGFLAVGGVRRFRRRGRSAPKEPGKNEKRRFLSCWAPPESYGALHCRPRPLRPMAREPPKPQTHGQPRTCEKCRLIDGETHASKRTCGSTVMVSGKRYNRTNDNALQMRVPRRRVPAGNGAGTRRIDRGEELLYA